MPNLIQLNRWYHAGDQDWVTTSPLDGTTEAGLIACGYINKTPLCSAYSEMPPGGVAVYRWGNDARKDWATFPDDGHQSDQSLIQQGYATKTLLCYAPAPHSQGTIDIYRWWHAGQGDWADIAPSAGVTDDVLKSWGYTDKTFIFSAFPLPNPGKSSGNFEVSADGQTVTWSSNVNFDDNGGSIAIGGNFKIILASNGDYTFTGHMHDSGFVGYSFTLAIAMAISSGITYTFSKSGSVEGTINALPFGTPERDSDWNISGNNPSVKDKWSDIIRSGQFVFRASTHDTFTSGVSDLLQAAIADAAKSLASNGIQAGAKALVALI